MTATKRAETISKAPLSITALGQATLDKQGIRDISGIARTTPGLTFQADGPFGGTNVSIRGIFSNIGAATTGIYIGDTPVQVRNGTDAGLQPIYSNLFDISRVEVLRGPQGTLYGAGSEGGTIRYILTSPSLTEASMYGRSEASTTKNGSPTFEMGGAVGGPLIDGVLGIRASGWARREGGWIDRIASTVVSDGRTLDKNSNSRRLAAGRIALLWQASPGVTFEPSVMYQTNNSRDTSLNWEIDGRYKQEGGLRQPSRSDYLIASNTGTADLGFATVTSVTSYLNGLGKNSADETYFDTATITGIFERTDPVRGGNAIILPEVSNFRASYDTRTRLKQVSQELRLSSNDTTAPISWVGGLYYQNSHSFSRQREFEPQFDALFNALGGIDTEDFFGSPLLPGNISYRQDVRVREGQVAAFADVNVKLFDRLKLELGGRYARTHYSFSRDQDGPWNGGYLFSVGRQREKPFTPKVGLTYETATGVIYASAAKGYRIGGANASLAGNVGCQQEIRRAFGQDDVPLTYTSDTLWSYEAGVKGRVLDNRVNFAASAFWVDWSKIQGNVTLQCLFSFTSNLGQAVSRGLDLSLSGRVLPGFNVGADLGYDDAHYTRDFLFSGALLAKKNDKLATPPFTAHLYADYRVPVSAGSGYGRLDYTYNARYRRQSSADVVGSDPTLSQAQRLSTVDMRIGYAVHGIDLSLFANNLFDDGGSQFRTRWAGSAYYLRATPRPRTIGATATITR